jgi:FkbM family methyltransferase
MIEQAQQTLVRRAQDLQRINWREERLIAFVLAQSRCGSLIVNRFDYNHAFNGHRYGVGSQILDTGSYDADEVETLQSLLMLLRKYRGDGVVALDCGANIGVHTINWAALMKGWGSVIAIEAQERIFYALAGNITLHNAFNARAVWAAVGREDGLIEIPEPDYRRPGSFGSFELKERLGNENIGQPIDYSSPKSRVRTMTIDGSALDRVDLIKLDVEGMELEALSGAMTTIKTYRPVLFIETIKIDKKKFEQVLGEVGYRFYAHGMNVLCVHADDPIVGHVRSEKKSR